MVPPVSPINPTGILELVRWLVNQGVAVAIALMVLNALGTKMDRQTDVINDTRLAMVQLGQDVKLACAQSALRP